MAHKLFAKDTGTGQCGWATPPCPPVVVAGNASVTVVNTGTPQAPVYSVTAPAAADTVTTLVFNAATGEYTYTNEAGATTVINLCAMASALPDLGDLACA